MLQFVIIPIQVVGYVLGTPTRFTFNMVQNSDSESLRWKFFEAKM